MARDAWPFLIGRAEYAGYRTVAVPDFLTDAEAIGALTSASGTVDLPEGAASARELRGLGIGPLTIVYRSFHPRGNDFGITGEDMLTDRAGRPIRITEGLVLRQSIQDAGLPRITEADLDQAHAQVAGAYRDFWRDGETFVRQTIGAQQLGESGSDSGSGSGSGSGSCSGSCSCSDEGLVRLVTAEPWDAQSTSTEEPRVRATARESLALEAYAGQTQPGLSPRPRTNGIKVGAAIAVGGIAVVIFLVLTMVGHKAAGKPAPPAAALLTRFCSALISGKSATADGYTQPQLASVRSLSPQAGTCTPKILTATASSATALLTVGPTPAVAWNVTLAPAADGTWKITLLTQALAGTS